MFKVRNVSYNYGNRKVVDDISLDIKRSCFYGIIGPNGCGKTTFTDLLSGIKYTAKGCVQYLDKNISKYSKKDLAREIAIVEQNFYIDFTYKVEEIVMMGRYPYIGRFSAPSDEDYKLVNSVMDKTGVAEFKNKSVTELSGGERQRVVFSRALAQDTPLLILDEATSNLDINHKISLLNLVSDSVGNKQRTIISVFQDLNLAALYCDELIVLKGGKLVESGKTEDVLNSNLLKSVFGVNTKIRDSNFSKSKQIQFNKNN